MVEQPGGSALAPASGSLGRCLGMRVWGRGARGLAIGRPTGRGGGKAVSFTGSPGPAGVAGWGGLDTDIGPISDSTTCHGRRCPAPIQFCRCSAAQWRQDGGGRCPAIIAAAATVPGPYGDGYLWLSAAAYIYNIMHTSDLALPLAGVGSYPPGPPCGGRILTA